MHKIGFLGHPMGVLGAIYALYLKVLTQRNFVAEFHRENVSFTRETVNYRFLLPIGYNCIFIATSGVKH